MEKLQIENQRKIEFNTKSNLCDLCEWSYHYTKV